MWLSKFFCYGFVQLCVLCKFVYRFFSVLETSSRWIRAVYGMRGHVVRLRRVAPRIHRWQTMTSPLHFISRSAANRESEWNSRGAPAAPTDRPPRFYSAVRLWRTPQGLCSRMVVFLTLECIGMVVRGVQGAVVGCGHQWREERKRQPGAYADRLSRHPVFANHHSETLQAGCETTILIHYPPQDRRSAVDAPAKLPVCRSAT